MHALSVKKACVTNLYAILAPSGSVTGFVAPAGKAVYFGDYVFVGNKTVELRRDIEAARLGVRSLIPGDLILNQAEPAVVAHIHPFLCTA